MTGRREQSSYSVIEFCLSKWKIPCELIQYEGSDKERQPNTMSWQFKRSNLSGELQQALEEITTFAKNSGPAIDCSAESISFMFQQIDRNEKQVILHIAKVY